MIDNDNVGPSAFEPIMNSSVPFEQPRNLGDPSGRIIGGQKAVQHRSFRKSCYQDRNLNSSKLKLILVTHGLSGLQPRVVLVRDLSYTEDGYSLPLIAAWTSERHHQENLGRK